MSKIASLMTLPLWIAYQSSANLKCWYGNESQDWVQVGDVATVENFIAPMIFAVPKDQRELMGQPILDFNANKSFSFVLKRDDSTSLAVYQAGTPATKLMSIFGEYTEAIVQLAGVLGLTVMSFEAVGDPGSFRLHARLTPCANQGELLRIQCLLRAGIEILSYTRGFEMSDLRWEDQ